MKYKHIFFDFDGTLADSMTGVADATKYALAKMGVPTNNEYGGVNFRRYLGPPLRFTFSELLPAPAEEDINRAITFYRERYQGGAMMDGTFLFEGVADTLEILKDRGYRLYTASSKPEMFIARIAEKLGIARFFSGMYGAMTDGTRETKEDVLIHAMKTAGCAVADSIMIGDRKYDLEASGALGMDCIAVTYGYGDLEELLRYSPVFVAHSPVEIAEFLI